MSKIIRLKTVFLTLVFSLNLGLTAVAQYTLTDDDVVVTDGTIQSCSYNFIIKEIIIPETLDGQTVTGIADKEFMEGVFYNKGISSIILPSSLVTIGDYSFNYNDLTSIDLSACAHISYIGRSAFGSNSLTSLNLTACSSLDSIGPNAFSSNSLTSIDLSTCSALTYIGYNAFNYNSMTSFTLPANTTYAYSCWLDQNGKIFKGGDEVLDLYSPYNLLIFYTLTDSDVVVTDGIIESCSYDFAFRGLIIPDYLDGQTVIGIADADYSNGVFREKGIKIIVFPSTIEKIGDYSFYYNDVLSIDLSSCSSLTYIGKRAFILNELLSLDLSTCTSLNYIGDNAFNYNNITSFTLPINASSPETGWIDANGSRYDGGDVVEDFDTWYKVPIPYTLTDYDVVVTDGIIQSCSYSFAQKDIIIPETLDGQTVIGIADQESSNGLFEHKGIESIVLPSTIEIIGDYAFAYNSLSSLDLSACSALISIGSRTFSGNSLSNLDLSVCPSLLVVGDYAFSGNSLAAVDLSASSALDSIGSGAFFYNNLNSIDLSACKALRYIGWSALYLNLLTSFTLPTNTTYASTCWLDDNGTLFEGGDEVHDLYSTYKLLALYTLTDSDVVVTEGIIESCSYNFEIKNIIIPDTLDDQPVIGIADKNHENGIFWNKSIENIFLPTTIEVIGDYAFHNNKLERVDFSNCSSLISIGEGAFRKNNISVVNLSGLDALECIGDYAFSFNPLTDANLSGCSSLTEINSGIFAEIEDGSRLSLRTLNLSNCSALTTIENYMFYHGRLQTLNLNGCISLTAIDYSAFSDNYLASINLSSCISLTYIGDGAFYDNNFTSFRLPTPEVPGLIFRYWLNYRQDEFAGGETVYDLSSDYRAKFWEGDGTNLIDVSNAGNNPGYIYPNPAKDIVYIHLFEDASISISDLSGKVILTREVLGGTTEIPVTHLTPGSYIFKVKSKNSVMTKKVLIE
jgi:hypothetical protein